MKMSNDCDKSIQTNNGKEEQTTDPGVDYPLDIWCVISEYIKPEDVGNFSRICKTTYYVTQSAKFWFHLYKCYYKSMSAVPQYLQPESMVHQYGLRAYVIRALHYTYFPVFLQHALYAQKNDPHLLVNRCCTLMWHKNNEERCYFYFKLKEIPNRRHATQPVQPKTNNESYYESIAFNPENGCKALRVTCLKYNMTPPVIGLVLQTVSMNLSRGFSHHRLHLGFGTSYIPKTPTQMVVLSEVVHVEILDWWQRYYPYQKIERKVTLPPTTDSWDQI